MKVHQEVYLKLKSLTGDQTVEVLRQFALEMSDWGFIEQQSEEYTQCIGLPSGVIQLNHGNTNPIFVITPYSSEMYYIANIGSMESRQILISEYNYLCTRFAEDFRSFIRKNKIPISITLSKEDVDLKEIIPNLKVRMFFKGYLNMWTASYHPNEIEKLDRFVCALSKYRKGIDLDLLRRYLVETLSWSNEDAEWCLKRIEIGLDVLKMNKSFH